MADKTDEQIKQGFWKKLADSPFLMIGNREEHSEPLTAQRAAEIGLVAKVVPHENLMDEAMKIARHILTLPPKHLEYTLNLLHRSRELRDNKELRDIDTQHYTELLYSPDTREASRAWAERRAPVFTGNQ